MFFEPAPTRYDLHFSIFGFPVRIHPLFWLMGILLGFSGFQEPIDIAIWLGVIFISILIHELGHTFMMRFYGVSSHIVLHLMGGLAIPDNRVYGASRGSLTYVQNIIISLAGPFAGFLLAGLLLLGVRLSGGFIQFASPIPFPQVFVLFGGQYVNYILNLLLIVNTFWGLINLLPVFPLDGGQVARGLFMIFNPRNGYANSLWLSVFTGGVIAVGSISRGDFYLGFLFGMLAFQSYQQLQYR